MKARLVRIGNSRGVRLPKPLIEEAGLTEEVEIRARQGAVIIAAVTRPRAGWAEAAARLRAEDGDRLLDPLSSTVFDADHRDAVRAGGVLGGDAADRLFP